MPSINPRHETALRTAITGVAVLIALVGAKALWTHYQDDPWTRDGRVRADVAQIAPDVAGLVAELRVHNDQSVHRGDVLFVIDGARYALALRQGEAAMAKAQAAMMRARAGVARAQATLGEARREAARNKGLGDLVATEITDQTQTKVTEAEAALAEAQTAIAEAEAQAEDAATARDLARLNLARTRVLAPFDGVLADVSVRVGDAVSPGKPVLALVDTGSIRVEGYFEETRLPRIHVGQSATIHLMGEAKALTGHVISIATAIEDHDRAANPNLLPAINPSFSWVRLAQRVPVRVALDKPPADVALIAGRTATVTLSTGALGEDHQR